MGILDSSALALKHKQRLITSRQKDQDGNYVAKTAIFSYPPDCPSKKMQGKVFSIKIDEWGTSEDKLKATDSVFDKDYVTFLILYEEIENTRDFEDSVNMQTSNYKKNNVTISYKSKTYVIEKEEPASFENGIRLHCRSMD